MSVAPPANARELAVELGKYIVTIGLEKEGFGELVPKTLERSTDEDHLRVAERAKDSCRIPLHAVVAVAKRALIVLSRSGYGDACMSIAEDRRKDWNSIQDALKNPSLAYFKELFTDFPGNDEGMRQMLNAVIEFGAET